MMLADEACRNTRGHWHCPFPNCSKHLRRSARGFGSEAGVRHHITSVHLQGLEEVPAWWLERHGLRVCVCCRLLTQRATTCNGPQCTFRIMSAWQNPHLPPADPDDGFAVPLSEVAPGFIDIFDYLKTPVAISRRVAPASANTVSQTLAILINGLLVKRTWGSLFRLLLFPRNRSGSP